MANTRIVEANIPLTRMFYCKLPILWFWKWKINVCQEYYCYFAHTFDYCGAITHSSATASWEFVTNLKASTLHSRQSNWNAVKMAIEEPIFMFTSVAFSWLLRHLQLVLAQFPQDLMHWEPCFYVKTMRLLPRDTSWSVRRAGQVTTKERSHVAFMHFGFADHEGTP